MKKDSDKKLPPSVNDEVDQKTSARRKLLKAVLTSGGVISTAEIVPKSWAAPIVNTIALPAHAVMTTAVQVAGLILGDNTGSTQDGNALDKPQLVDKVIDLVVPAAVAGLTPTNFIGCCITVTVADLNASNNLQNVGITLECSGGATNTGMGSLD